MQCKECGNDTDFLYTLKVEARRVKLCEDCIDRMREQGEVAEEAKVVVREMTAYRSETTRR